MKRRRRQGILGLVVLLCVCGLGYVSTHGGPVTVLRLPPVRDATTPAVQNGYALLGIRREPDTVYYRDPAQSPGEYERRGGYVLQIRPPAPAAPSGAYTATARSSTGDVFPLFWRADASAGPPRLLVTIPPAYPDTYRSLDVTVRDPAGRTARWCFTRLQRMRHVFSAPVVHDTVQAAGLTLHGQAFWQRSRGVPADTALILGITGKPNTGLHYDFALGATDREWSPFSLPIVRDRAGDPGWEPYASYGISDTDNPGGGPGTIIIASDTPYNKFVTFWGGLREFDTYDETVTFNNLDIAHPPVRGDTSLFLVVRQPQTRTTPSGITVTLPAQTHDWEDTCHTEADYAGVNMRVLLAQNAKSVLLPASPLCRKYHRPVSLTADFPPPLRFGGRISTGGCDGLVVAFRAPKMPPKHLNTLTLIVRQRVDLRTIPVHLVLPVAPAPPNFPAPKPALKRA